ncbi:hypothetical protein [uncultured Stenotrophomonas sp.]|mgnify:CR=1 FL=1|uniref:hypothetical protein n=1 Tax=uncultured Stenotrophomonas sp. TaxID=165438 RepID=UPI0025CE9A40|nr:hypothetical protein [uncultured Stenotrophomonas sp.]
MFRLSLLLCLLLAVTACSSPAATAPVTSQTPAPVPASEQSPPAKSAATPVVVDSSCKVDADCTVKNVGNCCGYYPACVNVNSPTDPAGVQASCQAKGMMSVCGFAEIQGCRCVNGQCASAGSSDPLRQPMTENPAAER